MIYDSTTSTLLDPYLENGFSPLPFELYLKMFGFSSHGAMDMRRSANYYRWRRDNPHESDAMTLGTLIHLMILEPQILETRMKLRKKVDGRTKDGKAYNEEFDANLLPTDIVVSHDQKTKLEKIRDSLMKNEFAQRVMTKPSLKENAGFFIHEATNVFCKIRPDMLFLEDGIIVDIKSTRNAHYSVFQRDVYSYMYDIQAAFYMDGYRAIMNKPAQFVWLCVETEGANDVAAYHATEKVYAFGKVRYEKSIRQFAKCWADDSWPGYPSGILPIDMPAWVENAEQNIEDMEAFIEENL